MNSHLFILGTLCSMFLLYNIIPKRNPFVFPKSNKIDKYVYVDDNGVCYKYVRKYIQ